MKKLFLILMLLVTLGGCINTKSYLKSTNNVVKWMEDDENVRPFSIPSYFAYADDSFLYCYDWYIGKQNKQVPVFFKIRKDSMRVVSHKVSFFEEQSDRAYQIVWTNRAGWIFHSRVVDSHAIQYYVSPIQFDTVKAKKIFQVQLDKNQELTLNEFIINGDQTLVTFISVINDLKTDQIYFNIICMDLNDLHIEWSHNYLFPAEIANLSEVVHFDIKVNQKGEPQLMYRSHVEGITDSKKKDGKRIANYEFRYLTFTNEGKIDRFKLNTESKFIKSIGFQTQQSILPIVCAYTYDKFNFDKLSGLFVFEVDDENKEVRKMKAVQFNKELIFAENEEQNEKIKQNQDFERTDKLRIVNVLKSEDSSIYVLGEVNYVYTPSFPPSGSGRIKSYFVSGNILVTRIDKNGNEVWTKVIPKSQIINTKMIGQVVYEGRPQSFASFMIDNKIHLFMNDNMKNYQSSAITRVKAWTGRNSCFVHTTIDSSGKYVMEPILDKNDHPLAIDISTIRLIDPNSIYINDHKTAGRLKF